MHRRSRASLSGLNKWHFDYAAESSEPFVISAPNLLSNIHASVIKARVSGKACTCIIVQVNTVVFISNYVIKVNNLLLDWCNLNFYIIKCIKWHQCGSAILHVFALFSMNSPQQVTCLEQSCLLLLLILKGHLLQLTFSTVHQPTPLPPP